MKILICRLTVFAVVFAASFASVLTSDCHAQWPYGQLGFGPFGHGYQNYYGYRGNIPTPPYFAIHPPVFYGERVERSYGISPFAALAPMHSDLAKPRNNGAKAMIVNPHCTEEIEVLPQADAHLGKASQPKVILNPFVVGETAKAQNQATELR
jgi:hypothetical protein